MMHLLFSFEGRIRRTNYWLGTIGAGFVLGIIATLVMMVFGGGAMLAARGSADAAGAAAGGLGIVAVLLFLVIFVVGFWIGLALQIKRWHDRDKSGVWFLINFIPFIGGLWTLIECGFMDGTAGPNRYGPSPKGIAGPAPTTAATA